MGQELVHRKREETPEMTVTLVTGANKGLGRETARRLIKEGHTVYIGARSVERGKAAADELGARFVQLDVTDDASVQAAVHLIQEEEGHLDVLVNNAGIGADGVTAEIARTVFDTNVVGVVRVTQAALPLLHKSGNPVVVNISSALGSFWAVTNPERPQSHNAFVVYGASKAAVSMLTVQYAKALPQIKFNAVEPGFTATDFTAAFPGGRPVEESAEVIVRMATIGKDGPTGTFQEDDHELAW
jgi:NAD(P)-dependent dehydrogenase (short-subunit alcohol dehydrogenase family)